MSEYTRLTERHNLISEALGLQGPLKNVREFRDAIKHMEQIAGFQKILSLLDSIEDEKKRSYAIRTVRGALRNRD